MEKSDKPNYFIMFPSHLMETLNPTDCIMMGLLISLAKRDGYAYPSNKMLEEFFNCSTDKIGRVLNNLETGGYIKREIVRDSNNQIVSRKIYPLSALMSIPIRKDADTLSANNDIPLSADLQIPYPQICGDIDINIYSNNKDIDKVDNIFNEIWEFYGKRGNKKTSHALFHKLNKNDLEAIRTHLPTYIENHKQNNKLEFLPHLTTYIRQRRYEDDLPYLNTKKDLTKTLIDWN
jgi:hypothetical protein